MKRLLLFLLLCLFSWSGQAQATKLVIRAKAKDAKFIGSSMGGALVIVRDHQNDRILAQGLTEGSTGNTQLIMKTPHKRYQDLSDEKTAKFEVVLDLQEPTLLDIEVLAPAHHASGRIKASTQAWLIPGKHIDGEGIVLEIPGFALTVLSPQTHRSVSLNQVKAGEVNIRANIVMMCGCTISKGGLWDSEAIEVNALIKKQGKVIKTIPLKITEQVNTFESLFQVDEPGLYEVMVYAYHAKSKNTGLDRVNFIVRN